MNVEVNKNETLIDSIPQDWGMYSELIDDIPSIVRTNLGLFDLAPIADYHHRVQVAVYYKTPTQNGLPASDENPKLWAIEDAISTPLNALEIVDVGLMKGANRVSFFMYTKVTEGIKEYFSELLQKNFPEYAFKIWVDEDKDWDCYFKLLYPNKYSMQQIQNNKVLDDLLRDGDDFSKKRIIEHWVYFKERDAADNFIKKATEANFNLFANETLDRGGVFYKIGVSRMDAPENIDQITRFLLNASEEFNGYYNGWGCSAEK